MFIDIHGHAYKYQYPAGNGDMLFITPNELLKKHDESGIERGVLLPLVSPEVYIPQSVGEIIDMANNSGGRFIPFCNIDPRALTNTSDAPLGNLLHHYKKLGCLGVGEVLPNMEFRDPRLQNLFKHVQEIGFPLIFDLSGYRGKYYGLYDDAGLPQLEECLNKFPELNFLGHGPAFWSEISTLVSPDDRYGYPNYPIRDEGAIPRLMRKYPNLLGDLSAGSGANAMKRDPEYAVEFMNEFQDRLYFGTDICTINQNAFLKDFLIALRKEIKISDVVFNKIARENTIKLLNLK